MTCTVGRMTDSRVWAQLVSTTDIETEPIQLENNKIMIGRNRGNDICLSENPFVSGSHCFIECDTESGIAWLHDTSTNGTLVNGAEKLVHQKTQLKHGDEIYIVNRKDDITHNVAFLFQVMEDLRREESLTSDSSMTSNDMNLTQPYDATLENLSADYGRPKRELSMEDITHPDSKRLRERSLSVPKRHNVEPIHRTSVEHDSQSTVIDHLQACGSISRTGDVMNIADGSHCSDTADTHLSKSSEKYRTVIGNSANQLGLASVGSPQPKESPTPITSALAEEARDQISLAPINQSKEPPQELCQDLDMPNSVRSSPNSAKASTSNSNKPLASSSDEMEESLQCVICQEILYKCVSAQPCMHSFCAGCYSEWMLRSSDCPSCRVKLERINKNHLVNNLVEAYLNANPEKRRPEAELKELDAKNKITDEMLTVYSKRYHDSEDDTTSDDVASDADEYDNDDDDEFFDDSDSSDDEDDDPSCGPTFRFARARARPNMHVCRQCPMYTGCTSVTPANMVPGTSALTSVAAVQRPIPPPLGYVCSATQTHMLCSCCMQPMPDRRHDHVTGVILPPQICAVCQRFYCHMYWGCLRFGCNGCLGKFSEFPVSQETLARLILSNDFESDILKQYLEARQISVAELLTECCQRLATGSYTCPDQHFLAGGSAAVCASCFQRNFAELAYQYRQDIPRDELPADALNRPDCYWGRCCRTQKCKQAHARNFNHICEQTRVA